MISANVFATAKKLTDGQCTYHMSQISIHWAQFDHILETSFKLTFSSQKRKTKQISLNSRMTKYHWSNKIYHLCPI